MFEGLGRDPCLEVIGLTKNQFYHKSNGCRPGQSPSTITKWRDPHTKIMYEQSNVELVNKIVEIKLDPDHANWYRMITRTLQIRGYYINHKKVYRLMMEYLLLDLARRRTGREFVQYRRVCPKGPLEIIEMDIKYVWITGTRKYAFVFTILDTFTRFVLHWSVGYTMKQDQIRDGWEEVIVDYLQPANMLERDIEVEPEK